MKNPIEDTQALSAEDVAELTGEAEEQDETGAPEKIAETGNLRPVETSDQQDRAPQPGNTPSPDESPRAGGTITGGNLADEH